MQFEGIYTPVVTPHHDDHSINEAAFEAVIEDLIKSGVHGLIVAGTTGEYYAQSVEERFHLMALAKQIMRLAKAKEGSEKCNLPAERQSIEPS